MYMIRWYVPLFVLVLWISVRSNLAWPLRDDEIGTPNMFSSSSAVTARGEQYKNRNSLAKKETDGSFRQRSTHRLPPSPAGLLKPDGFQFYTYNERGDMITKQMSIQEIQALIAGGGPDHLNMEIQEPQKAEDILTGGKKVMDVVQKVQSVLKSALDKPSTLKGSVPTIPQQANDEWSNILPSILAGDSETSVTSTNRINEITPYIEATTETTKTHEINDLFAHHQQDTMETVPLKSPDNTRFPSIVTTSTIIETITNPSTLVYSGGTEESTVVDGGEGETVEITVPQTQPTRYTLPYFVTKSDTEKPMIPVPVITTEQKQSIRPGTTETPVYQKLSGLVSRNNVSNEENNYTASSTSTRIIAQTTVRNDQSTEREIILDQIASTIKPVDPIDDTPHTEVRTTSLTTESSIVENDTETTKSTDVESVGSLGPLSTELVDSLSSVISQVSEAVSSVLPGSSALGSPNERPITINEQEAKNDERDDNVGVQVTIAMPGITATPKPVGNFDETWKNDSKKVFNASTTPIIDASETTKVHYNEGDVAPTSTDKTTHENNLSTNESIDDSTLGSSTFSMDSTRREETSTSESVSLQIVEKENFSSTTKITLNGESTSEVRATTSSLLFTTTTPEILEIPETPQSITKVASPLKVSTQSTVISSNDPVSTIDEILKNIFTEASTPTVEAILLPDVIDHLSTKTLASGLIAGFKSNTTENLIFTTTNLPYLPDRTISDTSSNKVSVATGDPSKELEAVNTVEEDTRLPTNAQPSVGTTSFSVHLENCTEFERIYGKENNTQYETPKEESTTSSSDTGFPNESENASIVETLTKVNRTNILTESTTPASSANYEALPSETPAYSQYTTLDALTVTMGVFNDGIGKGENVSTTSKDESNVNTNTIEDFNNETNRNNETSRLEPSETFTPEVDAKVDDEHRSTITSTSTTAMETVSSTTKYQVSPMSTDSSTDRRTTVQNLDKPTSNRERPNFVEYEETKLVPKESTAKDDREPAFTTSSTISDVNRPVDESSDPSRPTIIPETSTERSKIASTASPNSISSYPDRNTDAEQTEDAAKISDGISLSLSSSLPWTNFTNFENTSTKEQTVKFTTISTLDRTNSESFTIKKTDETENSSEEKWQLVSLHQVTAAPIAFTSSSKTRLGETKTQTTAQSPSPAEEVAGSGVTDIPLETTEATTLALDASKSVGGLDTSTRNTSVDIVNFSRLCNELAFKFWIAANKGLSTGRSLALSPFGMVSLLAMIFLGARGATSDQMNEILGLDNVATFNPHLIFQNVTDTVSLARQQGIANAAFVRELFADKGKVRKLMPFYKEQAQQFYEGLVAEVNFATISDLARRRTNLLIRKQTGGRIKDFVKSNAVPLRSPLAAISANVFQTDCNSSMASTFGRDGELYFAVSSAVRLRKLIPVPATVWRSTILAGYEPSLDATVVALGGVQKLVSTIFLLPGQQGHVAPGDTLDRLEQRLIGGAFRDGAWNKLLKVLIPRNGLELQVPKFSHRSVVNATAALKRMGLDQLFSGRADFKGINGVGNHLFLSDVLQMNLFSTCGDENIANGRHHIETYPASPSRNARLRRTETSTLDRMHLRTIRSTKSERSTEKPRLKLDQPFLYFVRHNPTGLILHMGRFNPRLLT